MVQYNIESSYIYISTFAIIVAELNFWPFSLNFTILEIIPKSCSYQALLNQHHSLTIINHTAGRHFQIPPPRAEIPTSRIQI
jgi:hypothetical protein